jgi:predicted nucleotidyltransferase
LKAWCDRSVNGEYKDAGDIATVCDWYQQDDDIRTSLYQTDNGRVDLLLRADMDVELASLYLLGEDISAVLGKVRVDELAAAWACTDREILAEFFARERSRTHPDRVRARNAITALTIAVFPTR